MLLGGPISGGGRRGVEKGVGVGVGVVLARRGVTHPPNVSSSAHSFDYRVVVTAAPPPADSTGTPALQLPSDSQLRAAVNAFSMLAEPTRLRLLWLVSAEELDVTSLANRVGVSASAVSQHLSRLRLAGLVDTRKAGRHVLYRARDAHVRSLIAEALFHADHQLSDLPDHR